MKKKLSFCLMLVCLALFCFASISCDDGVQDLIQEGYATIVVNNRYPFPITEIWGISPTDSAGFIHPIDNLNITPGNSQTFNKWMTAFRSGNRVIIWTSDPATLFNPNNPGIFFPNSDNTHFHTAVTTDDLSGTVFFMPLKTTIITLTATGEITFTEPF